MKLLRNFIFLKLERVYTYKSYVFVSKRQILGFVRYSFRKVILITISIDRPKRPWNLLSLKNTFYDIACSIPFVLLFFWSVTFEKLDCKHLRGSHLLTFLWLSGADLYVMSRWPDTSVFHSPIPALVRRPKFITPSSLKGISLWGAALKRGMAEWRDGGNAENPPKS